VNQSVLTACLTLAGGVILLVVTQVITRFIVEPLLDFRRLLGEVAFTLILYEKFLINVPSTAGTDQFSEAKEQCRVLASRLFAVSAAVPLYDYLAANGCVPPIGDVDAAAGYLIGLSNLSERATMPEVAQRYKRIAKLLRIRIDTTLPD
jgi:hypothetical protein